MIGWWIRRRIRAFERHYGYDMQYARDMLAISGTGFRRFAPVMEMAAYREDAPAAAWFAAKLAATLVEDCGPCTQLGLDMAAEAGIPAGVLRAIVRGDVDAMGAEAALGWRFAQAVLARQAQADELRQEIRRRWGDRALLSLALGIAAVRVFPSVKYALGHGHACTRLRIGDDAAVTPQRLAPA